MVYLLLPAINNPLVIAQNVLPEQGICAHRGAMATHPENTVLAFKEAVRLQVQMIELDVRLTKDKQLVIIHDETADRTTNGSGRVDSLTFKELKQLDAGSWKSVEFQNEKIPTLTEGISKLPYDIWLNIHLKGDRELGRMVAEVLVKEGRLHQAILACGAEAANGAHEINPDIVICNMDRQNNMEEYVLKTIENKDPFIQLYKVPVDTAIIKYVKLLKANNVKINYCCTDSPKEVKKLFDYGVDFVFSMNWTR